MNSHLCGLILCWGSALDELDRGLVGRLYRWWARPEANAPAGLGTGGGSKPGCHVVQLRFGEVSKCLLVKAEFIQFFHKQRTSSH